MAVDYYLVVPCAVRERVNDDELLTLEKAKGRATSVLNQLRAVPGPHHDRPEPEWTFSIAETGPDGTGEVVTTVGELLATAAPLDELAPLCDKCPLRGGTTEAPPFFCGGTIRYPISAAAEQWLLARLPNRIDERGGQILQKYLQDLNCDGATVNELRSHGGFYESPEPFVREWMNVTPTKNDGTPGAMERIVVSSSQVLSLMFDAGHYEPPYARLIGCVLGYMVPDMREMAERVDNRILPSDDMGITDLKRFLARVATAGVNNWPVFVDA